MRGLRSSVALLALLSAATGAFAQEAAGGNPVFTLTGTGGVSAFSVPSFDTGFFGHTAGGTLFGGMMGGNLSASVGDVNDMSVILGLNAFGAFGMGSTNWTDTFSGQGTVVITGLTVPGGAATIDLDPPNGDADVTGVVSATGNITVGGGPVNVGFVVPDGAGFIGGVFAGSSGGGGTGMSGGFIADTSGGVVAIAGNLDGLSISTSTSRSISYVGSDFTVGLAGDVSDTVALQVYAGPSYRGLFGTEQTKVTVNFAEQAPSAVTFPEFSITQTDNLTGHYFGGLIGMSGAIVTSPGVVFSLGVEGGLYNVNASWSGNNTYSTCCGDFQTGGGAVGGGTGASPNLSVSSTPLTHNFASAMALNAKANAGMTFALAENRAVTVGGSVEYLSHVAQVNHPSQTTTTTGVGTVTSFAAPAASTFSWASMFNFTGTVSLTGSF